MAEKVYISPLEIIPGYYYMADKKQNINISGAILIIAILASCSPKAQPAPTPDMGALATQMWVDLSVQQTLAAANPTATPLPTAAPTLIPTPTLLSTPLPVPADPENAPPVYNPVNNMELAYIPAGEFLMGSNPYDHDLDENELPQHSVYLDAFWISKTQVTNAMFTACVNSGICKYSASLTTNPHYLDSLYANHPVVYVSWEMAQTYCHWTGGSLPTEAEWEKAARGTDGARYAWGEERPRLKFVNAGNEYGTTSIVGSFPYGVSTYGVFDMGGNVREWVSDWFDPAYYQYTPDRNPMGPETGDKKVLKGASFSDDIRYCRPSNRLAHEPVSPGNVRGFRCVYP